MTVIEVNGTLYTNNLVDASRSCIIFNYDASMTPLADSTSAYWSERDASDVRFRGQLWTKVGENLSNITYTTDASGRPVIGHFYDDNYNLYTYDSSNNTVNSIDLYQYTPTLN